MNSERKLRGEKSRIRERFPSSSGFFLYPQPIQKFSNQFFLLSSFFLPHLRAVSAAHVPHWSLLSCLKSPTSALFLLSIAACASIFFLFFLVRFFFSLFFPRLAFYRFFLILYASIGTCLVCFSLNLFRTRLGRLPLTSPQSNLDSGGYNSHYFCTSLATSGINPKRNTAAPRFSVSLSF